MGIRYLGDDPLALLAKAEALAADLRLLLTVGHPHDADLLSAPVLNPWRPTTRQSTALLGVVTGHPLIRDHGLAITSDVFAIDPSAGWARSWSRLYRIGLPDDGRVGRPQ